MSGWFRFFEGFAGGFGMFSWECIRECLGRLGLGFRVRV